MAVLEEHQDDPVVDHVWGVADIVPVLSWQKPVLAKRGRAPEARRLKLRTVARRNEKPTDRLPSPLQCALMQIKVPFPM
jgi:hypothetical protein